MGRLERKKAVCQLTRVQGTSTCGHPLGSDTVQLPEPPKAQGTAAGAKAAAQQVVERPLDGNKPRDSSCSPEMRSDAPAESYASVLEGTCFTICVLLEKWLEQLHEIRPRDRNHGGGTGTLVS